MFENLFKRRKQKNNKEKSYPYMRSSVNDDIKNNLDETEVVNIEPTDETKDLTDISKDNIYPIKSININGEKINNTDCTFNIKKNQTMTKIDIVVKNTKTKATNEEHEIEDEE